MTHPVQDEDVTRWLAAATVGSRTTQHPCTGDDHTCAHRNHRRDADYRAFILAQLGLTKSTPENQCTKQEGETQ